MKGALSWLSTMNLCCSMYHRLFLCSALPGLHLAELVPAVLIDLQPEQHRSANQQLLAGGAAATAAWLLSAQADMLRRKGRSADLL